MTKPTIGFIGLGLMGSNMVECLQKNGFELTIMSRKAEIRDAAVARGATVASSPQWSSTTAHQSPPLPKKLAPISPQRAQA